MVTKIIGKTIEIHLLHGRTGRNKKNEWLPAPANEKNDWPLAPAHTHID